MFRRKWSTVPKDFEFPTDLAGLGYFLNDRDQIRMIEDPTQPFHFFISKNERYVERQKEAMNHCLRSILHSRMLELGFVSLPLPLKLNIGAWDLCAGGQSSLTSSSRDIEPRSSSLRPPKGNQCINPNLGSCLQYLDFESPHIPIWVSKNLLYASPSKIIVYFGESIQDLGVIAGRTMNHNSINEGSIVGLVRAAMEDPNPLVAPDTNPGIVVANPGQLLWSKRYGYALSWQSWYALPRDNVVGPNFEVTDSNRVPRNEDVAAHVSCVLEDVVLPRCLYPNAYLVAVGDTVLEVVDYLQANWASCSNKIRGLVILGPNHIGQTFFYDEAFKDWFGSYARAYVVSDQPLGTPLQGRSRLGCNVFSGGEPSVVECIMQYAKFEILRYFNILAKFPEYQQPAQDFDEEPSCEVANIHGSWSTAETVPENTASLSEPVVKETEIQLPKPTDIQNLVSISFASDAQPHSTDVCPSLDLSHMHDTPGVLNNDQSNSELAQFSDDMSPLLMSTNRRRSPLHDRTSRARSISVSSAGSAEDLRNRLPRAEEDQQSKLATSDAQQQHEKEVPLDQSSRAHDHRSTMAHDAEKASCKRGASVFTSTPHAHGRIRYPMHVGRDIIRSYRGFTAILSQPQLSLGGLLPPSVANSAGYRAGSGLVTKEGTRYDGRPRPPSPTSSGFPVDDCNALAKQTISHSTPKNDTHVGDVRHEKATPELFRKRLSPGIANDLKHLNEASGPSSPVESSNDRNETSDDHDYPSPFHSPPPPPPPPHSSPALEPGRSGTSFEAAIREASRAQTATPRDGHQVNDLAVHETNSA